MINHTADPSGADKKRDFYVTIRDINERGQGVGTVTKPPGADGEDGQEDTALGKVAFVDGALPGELVLARLREEKSHYLVLDLIQVQEASGDRQASDCPYFPDCGSCQLRHMSYEAELAFKEKRVKDQLSRSGPLAADSPAFKAILGMDHPNHYRGKSIFPIQDNKEGPEPPYLIGQYRRGSHELVDLQSCLIQSQIALALVNQVRQLLREDPVILYDEATHQGCLSHLVVRTAFSSRQIMLIFVVHDGSLDDRIQDWLPSLHETADQAGVTLASVWLNDREDRGNRILSTRYRHIEGAPNIEESINGVNYKISPDSFFQVNPVQAALLFQEVIRAADLQPGDRVLDLYSGVGAISLQLAHAAKGLQPPVEITGVDNVEQAIMDAQLNADINELTNLTFIKADANAWLADFEDNPDNPPFDLMVVDPPRKGLGPQGLEVIINSQTPRLIYVSCNPSTLARDLSRLSETYQVESVQPVDMFPRTTHVETVVLMSRLG
ncbi:MAG: 23S rRNA (uracil(1939)-C(5))-methyltransferase RlmD [Clostridiaceae bacterium]|nr:23S rRNA (uracil(1939)-C(5))-methyltransferase RlmD [Clostridiaceae bacterium]NLA82017.1 23S rRNA (uracil(1939)-C(5))-methyltransferase RlmD [Clostridiaceae bacterium]